MKAFPLSQIQNSTMPPWIYTVLGRRWFRDRRKETAALKIKAAAP